MLISAIVSWKKNQRTTIDLNQKGHGCIPKILALLGVELSSALGRYQFTRMLGLKALQIQKSCDFYVAVSLAKGTVLNVVCMSML